MRRPLNPGQLEALQWFADGCPPGQRDVNFKLSAGAVRERGLITLLRKRPWSAELTALGHYVLAHGRYPPPSEIRYVERRVVSRRARTPTPQPEAPAPGPYVFRFVVAEAIPGHDGPWALPVATSLEGAGQYIRDLAAQPALLRLPEKHQRRGVLILHTLVSDALARGWTVTPLPVPALDEPVSVMGPALVSIGAEQQSYKLRMRMLRRQRNARDRPIVTLEEIARAEYEGLRDDYVDPRSTDILRVELVRGGAMFKKIQDTKYGPVEQKLVQLPHAICKALA